MSRNGPAVLFVLFSLAQSAFAAPIHEAAERGDIEALQQELNQGVPVDLRFSIEVLFHPSRGTTALMWAAARGQVAAVRFLIAAKADVDAQSGTGITPLMAAAGAIQTTEGDPLACVEALLKAGADVNATCARTETPVQTSLFFACGNGKAFDDPPTDLLLPEYRLPNLYRLLRPEERGTIDLGGPSVPDRVVHARHGDAARVKALLQAGASVNVRASDGTTPLMAACEYADAARVRLLLEAGAKVNQKTKHGTAVILAARYGTAETFKLILEAGGSFDASLFGDAAVSGEDAGEKARIMLQRGADPNMPSSDGSSPLLSSLRYSDCDSAPVLLDAGANPHIVDHNGNSAFILAAENGPAGGLDRLLKLGFNPEERSKQDEHATALILAATSERDSAEKVRLLLAAGAEIDAEDNQGCTALLSASREGNMDTVVVLAESGANANVTDAYCETPLHYVANRGQDDCQMCEQTGRAAARSLIKHGARINARDRRGRTAKMLAEAIKHTEVLAVIDGAQP